MFIEDAVTNSKIDGNFFKTWWNTNIDWNTFYSRPAQTNVRIANWKVPQASTSKPAAVDKWRTLNNLVFNALGSAENREDFVLCDYKINGWKEKLWHGKKPMNDDVFKKLSDDVAKGAITSDVHLSAIQTVSVNSYLLSS